MMRMTAVLSSLAVLIAAGPGRAGFVLDTQTVGTQGAYTNISVPGAPAVGAVLPFNTALFATRNSTTFAGFENSFVLTVPDPVDPFNGTRLAGVIQLYDQNSTSVASFLYTATPGDPVVTLTILGANAGPDAQFSRLGVPENVPSIAATEGSFLSYALSITLTGATVVTNGSDIEVTGFTGISGTFSGVFRNLTRPPDDSPLDGDYTFEVTIGSAFTTAAAPAPPAAVLLGIGFAGLAARRARAARA